MTQPLDFQSIILTLQHFWAEQGCLIWQPYYTQVGAGTMNPATFLRVLGPEPWNVAYVEPSIRPDDGRYGENPNRMQQHYQMQVILKPDPGNPQELYLNSLEALGIDPSKHDIRFVEDNWQQPALGAWGLGWEVWLDGQEITQFTYFQQAGGIILDPVSVELTYGLDRIAIAVQRVQGFQDILWNSPSGRRKSWSRALTAGDVNLQAEQEHSRYYFEVADVGRVRNMYDLFEAEAHAALAQGLVLPAYDYLLKCSHTFNILDTRGAIGVTERQAYFGRMRELARQVATAYVMGRQRLEFPWQEKAKEKGSAGAKESFSQTSSGIETSPNLNSPAALLLEIGTEELPPDDLEAALEQLRKRVPDMLGELRLEYGEVRILGTPRRLVIFVDDLAPCQLDLEHVYKGPPSNRAFDLFGTPTQAAEGFARSKGIPVSDLQVQEIDGGSYAVAVLHIAGRTALEVLSEAIPSLIASLRFDKSMRWNSTNVVFSRPIRWLVALYGDRVIPFDYAGLKASNKTRGLRFDEPREMYVRSPSEYFATISQQGILLDGRERKARILEQVNQLASAVKGEVADDPDLLAEVADLVEAPAALRGSFDPSHLQLPREVLISVMKKHQRYYPVEQDGKLLPCFIAVSNQSSSVPGDDRELIVEGNEHVIRARFADAAFFVREDLKKPLASYVPLLSTLTFQADLGSMLDKTQRIKSLVGELGDQIGLDPHQVEVSMRAAELCKADLVTKMVVEMTSLQGIMGRIYALLSGETEEVGIAILEHYLPRFAGDLTPKSSPGLAVGLADRLDTLTGLFAAGLAPTGAKDPFGQRRTALGLVSNLIAWDLDFNLRAALSAAAARLPITMPLENQGVCLAFIIERLRNLLLEQGCRYGVVESVVTAQGNNPAAAVRAVKELTAWVEKPDWNTILPAYARCVRITRELKVRYSVKLDSFIETAESDLYRALQSAEAAPRAAGSVDDFLNAFLPMIPVINRFFDQVLVMTEEANLRENRLGMLQRIAALADGVADMSRLEGF